MRNPFDDPSIQYLLRVTREMDRMGLDNPTLSRMQEQQRLIDSLPSAQDRLMRDLILKDELADNATKRLIRMSSPIDSGRNSALFDLTKSANQSMLHLLNDIQPDSAVVAHLANISKEWDERVRLLRDLVPETTVDLALKSHLSRITEISSLAQASLANLPSDRIGEAIRLSTEYRADLRDRLLDFSHSYRDLIKSFETSQTNLLSLPPALSELPSVSYYTGARLTKSISVPTPGVETEEGEDDIQAEIAAETADNLEALLAELDPKFIPRLKGAQRALDSDNPDRARHFAISMSELHAQVLERLAPDDEVKAWSGTSVQLDEKGRPTFEARLRYISRRANHQPLSDYIVKNFALDVEFLKGFQRGIHEVGVDYKPEHLSDLSVRMESTLRLMIEAAGADASDTTLVDDGEEGPGMDVEETATTITTPPPDQSEPQSAEVAHVLFMDIVGYSKLTMDQQARFRQQLKKIVRSSQEYGRAQTGGNRLISGQQVTAWRWCFSAPLKPRAAVL